METKVEVLEGDRAKVIVTIDAATVTERVKKQYRDLAGRYNFPGFRKGKAPRPIVDNMLGKDAAVAMVTDDLVNETCPIAIDESGLYPVGKPEFDEDMALVKDKEEFTYFFTIATKPKRTLSSYDPVEIELPAEGASDAEIDAEIDALRAHYYDLVDAAEGTQIGAESFFEMKIAATDDAGEPIEFINSDSTTYGMGTGLYPKAFEEQVMGLAAGDKKSFSIAVPTDAAAITSTLRGKTANVGFDVEILGVKERALPELTDEWVQNKLGLDDVASLRKEFSDEIQQSKLTYLPRMKENRVLMALEERLEGDIPEGLVEENETNLLQDFFTQLQRQGITLDAYLKQQDITSQQFRDDVKAQALDMTKQDLALDAWAAQANLQVTDEDIQKEFEDSGAADPEALLADWKRNGQMYLIRQGILRQKAVNDAVSLAVVKRIGAGEEPAEEAAAETAEEAEPAEPAEAAAAPEDAPAAEEAAPKKTGKHAKKAEEEQENTEV